jgi:hypothetical protein
MCYQICSEKVFNSPLAMHAVLVYLGRAAGHVAAKTCHAHARQVIVILRWWAAPRCIFSSDTLPPLTLFRMVVLSHALRIEQAGSEQNFVLAVCASEIDLPEF